MDIEGWEKKDREKSSEYLDKALEKLSKGQKIDWFEDILPEFKDLKEESYAVLHPAISPEECEFFPTSNLGLLLGSGIYSKVLIPLRPYLDKSTFKFRYALSENIGARISFEQFLSLVKDGKLKICLIASPKNYTTELYREIFKSCDELPIFPNYRTSVFINRMKLASIAISSKIEPSEHWLEMMLKLHPEYGFRNCVEESRHAFGDYLKTIGQQRDIPSEQNAAEVIATELWQLRSLGFERLAELVLRCTSINEKLGDRMLSSYHEFLVAPVITDLFAFQNYGVQDIQEMSFLKVLPKRLETIWKDVISSSPISSSVTSPQIGLDAVMLKGTELLRLIENFHDDSNAGKLRQNVVDVNTSLGKFDIQQAERGFDRVDEIITESINSEVKSYEKKGRIVNHLLRLGKTFTSVSAEGSAVLSGFLAASGKFDLAITALAGVGVSAWVREKLGEIKSEDIVRWWSRSWPLDDPGIGFFMWEKAQQRKSADTLSDRTRRS